MKILFVCTGNTCRSPMAEALLVHKMPEARVQSAGIFAGENQHANQHSVEALKQHQIKLDHRSQPVESRLLNWADLVLTMTTQHKQSLILQYPNFQDKFYTLKEYVSDSDKEVWTELRKLYADYEEKRSLFVQENQHKLDNTILDQKLAEHLRKDVERIHQLEGDLINYDISDPFGGSLEIYQETLKEIETYVDLLVEKLKKEK